MVVRCRRRNTLLTLCICAVFFAVVFESAIAFAPITSATFMEVRKQQSPFLATSENGPEEVEDDGWGRENNGSDAFTPKELQNRYFWEIISGIERVKQLYILL